MAVLFKGNGLVYIPEKSRYIRFVNGVYSTNDKAEIAQLKKRYEYTGDIKPDPAITIPVQPENQEEPKKKGRPRNVVHP